jgi:hypothetical protein
MGVPDRLAARLSIAEQHALLVSRRTLMTAAARVAASMVIGGPAAAFWLQPDTLPGRMVVPFGRHLAWGANPRTTVSVGWQVPHRVKRPFLRVGPSPDALGPRIDAEIRPLRTDLGGIMPATEQYYVHATAGGLRPGTTYYYAVGHAGYDPTDLTDYGRVDTFTTAPSRRGVAGPFTFTAFGDQGVSSHALANDGMLIAQRPAFHLHAGDLCYADTSGKGRMTDFYHPRAWDQFLAQNEPVAATVPWMACLGNHDMEVLYSADGYDGQRARWDFPANGPARAAGVYSFIYGNVGVIALDANDVCHELSGNRDYTGGAQTAWLDQRLGDLRHQPDVDFVVVFFHHCAYSTSTAHASDGGVRRHWVPLFDKHEVDLVINGHNHVYERADALRAGVPTRVEIGGTVDPRRDGTVYVTAGGGGRSLYSFDAPDSFAGRRGHVDEIESYVWVDGPGHVPEQIPERVTWSRVRYTGYSFVAVDVEPARAGHTSTLTLRAVTEDGAEIDRVVIARRAGGGSRARLNDQSA